RTIGISPIPARIAKPGRTRNDQPEESPLTETPPAQPSYSSSRAIILGGGALAMPRLPVFLPGAWGVQLTEEPEFGAVCLGAAIATHRLASTPAAMVGGRLADRLGASRTLRLSAITAGASCLGIATTARSFLTLAVWLALAGCSLALSDPAANRLL